MKKIISLTITLSILIAHAFSLQTFAEDNVYTDDKIEYTYYVNNGEAVIKRVKLNTLMYDTEIDIPEKIDEYTVTELADDACCDVVKVSKITIPNGVKKIGANTFDSCTKLKTVVLSETLEYIEEGAFSDCKNLETITLPETLLSIGRWAFSGCSSLSEIYIPDSCKTIIGQAFRGCTALKTLRLPDNIDTLGDFVFADCEKLTDVQWNKSVKNPGVGIFTNTKYLSDTLNHLLLLNNDTYLCEYDGSDDFIIPDSVTEIGIAPFMESSAKKVTLPAKFTNVPSRLCLSMKYLKEIVLEGDIEFIASGAFSGCESLEEFTVPNGTKSLGQSAFYGCTSLKTINLPNTLEYIGVTAFSNCTSLKNITLPTSLLTIENNAFYQCSALESIEIPTSVMQLGTGAFNWCTGLKSVTLPSQVTGVYAFYMANDIETVKVTNGTADPYVVYNIFRTTKWAKSNKPKSETGFNIIDGELAEYDGDSRNPVIPEGVTSIGTRAFRSADIDTVTIPSTVTVIKSSAFMNSNIKEITIPKNVQKIEVQAFAWCKKLEKVVVSEGVKSIASLAFTECTSLIPEEVIIPESVNCHKEAFMNTPLDENWLAYNKTPEPESTKKPETSPEPSASPSPSATPSASPKPILKVLSDNEYIIIKTDENDINFPDAQPFIDENDRTQTPVRAVAEALGCTVEYEHDSRLVTISSDGNIIKLTIGSDILYKNDAPLQMDTQAVIIDDRTYIPVRFIAEALGYEVSWN